MLKKDDSSADLVLSDLRLAGQVERYHTWPTLHRQSVAEHTWQLLRVYTSIFGVPEKNVMQAIMFHDCGEIAVGDAPYPSKARDKDFKVAHNRLEETALNNLLEYWDIPAAPPSAPSVAKKIKVSEYIEMAEEGLHEWLLGSKYGWIVAERCLLKVQEYKTELADSAWVQVNLYLAKRLTLTIELAHHSQTEILTNLFKEFIQ
jgi:hypothetical protein